MNSIHEIKKSRNQTTLRIRNSQKAFQQKNNSALLENHTVKAIQASIEKHKTSSGKYIKDIIYGGLDGIITTFAIVSGVAGASLPSSIVLILGFANLLADGFSMAVGNYLGTKSEMEYTKKEREREEYEVDNFPEGEIEEIRQIYSKKGFKGEDLERVVSVITSNKDVWIDTMMVEELELLSTMDQDFPIKSAFVTFLSFVLIGMIPLSTYIIAILFPQMLKYAFGITTALTALTIFSVGAIKSKLTGLNWLRSGFEMLLIGGAAASVAYSIGFSLKGFSFEDPN